MAFDPEVFVNQYLAVESFVQYLAYYRGVSKPTVSLGVTSAVVSSCGHNSGQIEQRVAHEFTVHLAT